MDKLQIKETSGAVEISVKVLPRSSRTEIVGILDGVLKVKLSSPPVDGAANAELIKLFSKTFNLSKSEIEIIGGATSRTKLIRLINVDAERVRAILQSKS